MQESKPAIIRVENISHSYGKKSVLEDISLSVAKGEFVTILGPSGCGKSTLLRLIAGFLKASDGQIFIDGVDMTQTPPHLRPVNTVFQRYALFPHLTVFENVAFGLQMKKRPKDEIERRVKQVLKMVSMTDYEARHVDSLSGGQQQRVAIARAIVNEPDVLLLDEPLAALDLKMRKDMQMEIKQMHRNLGISFLYVTHDQEEALTLSDRIVVMSEGRIQQIGSPTDIYNEPANAFVADFIGESNILNGTMIKDKLVAFAGHQFECVDTGFALNELVDVVIRPEDIYIFDKNDSAQMTGVVSSSIFKGVHYEMMVTTAEGFEIMVQDYQCFAVGKTVGLLVKPFDVHVMKKEATTNLFEGMVIDKTHVKLNNHTFKCSTAAQFAAGSRVKTSVGFDGLVVHDNEADGVIRGAISFILYKGNHYHLTIRTENNEHYFADTQDIWDVGDRVGISFVSDALLLVAQ